MGKELLCQGKLFAPVLVAGSGDVQGFVLQNGQWCGLELDASDCQVPLCNG